jgi:hypothetical protein
MLLWASKPHPAALEGNGECKNTYNPRDIMIVVVPHSAPQFSHIRWQPGFVSLTGEAQRQSGYGCPQFPNEGRAKACRGRRSGSTMPMTCDFYMVTFDSRDPAPAEDSHDGKDMDRLVGNYHPSVCLRRRRVSSN